MLHLRGADLVTIQVGGNEVDFFPILNECIEQWRPLSTCDREIDRARNLIQSTKFIQAFDDMVKHATSRVDARAQVLVLGYARFFNATTQQCNSATFSKTNPANVLSNKLRASFNGLVEMLNDVIKACAQAHGAIYVDTDEVFHGHRFCEEGVEEPRPDWEGTWFFRESAPSAAEDTIWEGQSVQEQDQQSFPNPFKRFADLTRTFHPTRQGHAAIAQHVSNIVAELDRQ